jgi:plastocyanin
MHFTRQIGATLFCLLACSQSIWAQVSDVSLKIDLVHAHTSETDHAHGREHDGTGSESVVVWLSPVQAGEAPPMPAKPQTSYVLVQKDRQFSPHLLIVPTGSSVEFPNLDPFFHNVFSLFNGKRFDLGLYEANSHRSVRFDREGVSYIFCNIHPEMGAVIISVSTPYYAVSAADGTVTIHNVPAGSYRLKMWAEDVPAGQLTAAERTVEIGNAHAQLGTIRLDARGDIMKQHKNKFGESYAPAHKDLY